MKSVYKWLIVAATVGSLAWLGMGCGGGGEEKKEAPKPAATKPAATGATAPKAGEPAKPTEAKAAEGWGSVKGQVVYGGANIPEPRLLFKEGDKGASKDETGHCAKHTVVSEELVVDPDTKGVQWAIVYLRERKPAVAASLKEPKEQQVVLDQEGCRFIPHALVVRGDQKLVVRSSDPIRHNTHTFPTRGQIFNKMLEANDKGQDMPLTGEVAPIQVKCDVHTYMSAWLGIFDHPYAVVTAKDGSFEIKDLPAGKRRLAIFQEKLAPQGKTVEVDVKPGETVTLDPITLEPGGVAQVAK